MNIKGKAGSKERLLEMMQGVNKVTINESAWQDRLNDTVNDAFKKLKSGALKLNQGGSNKATMQTVGDQSYIGVNGYDAQGNMYNFNFRIEATEGDQDGVGFVNDVVLEEFSYTNPQGQKVFDVNEDDLRDFNKQHGPELYDAIEDYIDMDTQAGEELGETIEKKKESDPYGGSSQDYQDHMGYGDEKPVNPKLRTKSPELEKFVKEDEEENPCWSGYEMVGMKDKDGKKVPNCVPKEDVNENEENGEDIIRKSFKRLSSDLEFSKMAQAYENLLKMKRNKQQAKKSTELALSSVRDMIADYLRDTKELNVTEEDVQNFFENWLSKYSSVVSENENEESDDDEVPAMDVNDVDNDGDKLEGGLGDQGDMMQYDPQEILKGIEVEMEHTKDPKIALEIAMDHLEELPDYYTRLKRMEDQGEKDLHSLDGDVPEDLEGYVQEINDADQELRNTLLGYGTGTPNIASEDYDFAAHEREYEDKRRYERFQELDSKPLESLSDEEKEEYYELWQEFGDV